MPIILCFPNLITSCGNLEDNYIGEYETCFEYNIIVYEYKCDVLEVDIHKFVLMIRLALVHLEIGILRSILA
jgi:hypothetical protein